VYINYTSQNCEPTTVTDLRGNIFKTDGTNECRLCASIFAISMLNIKCRVCGTDFVPYFLILSEYTYKTLLLSIVISRASWQINMKPPPKSKGYSKYIFHFKKHFILTHQGRSYRKTIRYFPCVDLNSKISKSRRKIVLSSYTTISAGYQTVDCF
jgi:hypothetical protein